MPRTVILGAARTPFGRLGGGLASLPAPQLGIHAGSAALERAGVSPDQVGYVVMGEVLQAGVGMIPSRQVSAGVGCPVGGRLRHDQQGLRLRHARDGLRRPADPLRRPRRGADRRHGEHVQRPLPGAQGPLRLHDGRRRAGRPHDQRRPHLHLHAPDHGRGELGRLGRDRVLAGGPGCLGAAQPRARRGGPGRRTPGRRDRGRDGARPQGRHRGRRRRGPAPRHVGRAAGGAEARVQQGRRHHRRKRARGQRRRRRAGAGVGGVGRGAGADAAGPDPQRGPGRRRLPLPGAHPGRGRAAWRWSGPA